MAMVLMGHLKKLCVVMNEAVEEDAKNVARTTELAQPVLAAAAAVGIIALVAAGRRRRRPDDVGKVVSSIAQPADIPGETRNLL